MTDKITEIVQSSGLQPDKTQALMKSFTGYFQEAKGIAEEAKQIVVTDETQTDLMVKAREARLKLKNIRVMADKTREELKAQSLREGNAIQGIFNVIKALVVPVEEYLEKQEKFAEMKEKARLEAVYSERIEKLSKYVGDVSLYNIKEMTDEVFDNLLEGCKSAFEARVQAEKEAEEQKVEQEKRERVYRDRMYMLNRFYNFIDINKLTIESSEDEYRAMVKEGQSAKEKYDQEQEKIQKDNEALQKKLDQERKRKEEIESELKAEKEAQEKKEKEARDAEEAQKKADEEAQKKAILAPDKDKLRELWRVIDSLQYPSVKSREAANIVNETANLITKAKDYLIEKAKTL